MWWCPLDFNGKIMYVIIKIHCGSENSSPKYHHTFIMLGVWKPHTTHTRRTLGALGMSTDEKSGVSNQAVGEKITQCFYTATTPKVRSSADIGFIHVSWWGLWLFFLSFFVVVSWREWNNLLHLTLLSPPPHTHTPCLPEMGDTTYIFFMDIFPPLWTCGVIFPPSTIMAEFCRRKIKLWKKV